MVRSGRLFGGGDAEAANFLRQFGQRLRDAVLDLDLGLINVGAELEGDGEGHDPVGRGLREHVERILDAVDGLLEGRGDGFGDGLGIGAGIGGAHDDGGRDDLGIFADGQAPHGEQADEEDDARQHAGEDGAADKEVWRSSY